MFLRKGMFLQLVFITVLTCFGLQISPEILASWWATNIITLIVSFCVFCFLLTQVRKVQQDNELLINLFCWFIVWLLIGAGVLIGTRSGLLRESFINLMMLDLYTITILTVILNICAVLKTIYVALGAK